MGDNLIQPGLVGEYHQTVTPELTADKIGSGNLPVFATPSMIALMEVAAVVALSPYLAEGQSSVGVALDVQHLAATPIGQTVRAEAEVTAVEDRRVIFRVQAWDQQELIGQGTHERVIIDAARFMARVDRKQG